MKTTLTKLFAQASIKYCHEDGCYLGTCPVNCIVFLLKGHVQRAIPFLIYGDYKLIERLAKEVGD